MALLSTQSVSYTGVTPALTSAAGGGDTFTPGPNMFLEIVNGAGSPMTVTVATPPTVRGLAVADLSVVVTNGQRRFVRISPADMMADTSTGFGNLSYTSATSVTVGVFQVQDT